MANLFTVAGFITHSKKEDECYIIYISTGAAFQITTNLFGT